VIDHSNHSPDFHYIIKGLVEKSKANKEVPDLDKKRSELDALVSWKEANIEPIIKRH